MSSFHCTPPSQAERNKARQITRPTLRMRYVKCDGPKAAQSAEAAAFDE